MFFPPIDDNVSILVNHLLYLLIVIRFDTLLFEQFELSTIPDKFGHATITLNMYVKRLMFFTVKEERESIESEYFWHISLCLLFLWCKYRNYFRYLQIFQNFLFLSFNNSDFYNTGTFCESVALQS